ncbi:MAG: HEAT repeat domain-containing protein, partial [Planctomycetota bacterium]
MSRHRTVPALLAFSAALLVSAPSALGHGGQYRGPHGEVPPDSRQPEDPPPPDSGPGTPTPPDPGAPTPTPPENDPGTPTPPDDGQPPKDGTPPTSGETPGPSGPKPPGTKTGGKRPARRGPSYESWQFWWNYNKDALLDLRARLRAQVAVSGDFGEFAGASSTNKGEAEDVTARALEGSVIPMLRELASDGEVHTDIQSAAILALAKMGRNEMLPTFQSLATGQSRSIRGPKIIEESSALALGLLQHRMDAVRDFLIELAGNQDAKTRTRSFALYSLGLLRPDGAPAGTCAVEIDAMSALAVDSGVPGDVRLAAIASMGLTEDPAAVAVLLPWLRSERAGGRSLQDLDLSVVASALGRIGTVRLDDETADEVVDALRDQFKRRNRLTRSSAAIALGRKGMVSDTRHRAEIRSVLAQVARGDLRRVQRQDTQFAAISLGRLAADSLDKSGRKALSTLMRLLEDRHAGTRSFAALGLALGVKDGTEEHRAVAGERILFHLSRDRGGMERRGALVIS